MPIATTSQLDDAHGQALACGIDIAWRRLTAAGLLDPSEHAHAQNMLTAYLLKLARRGERSAERLARRGIFFICGVLAAPQPVFSVGRSVPTGEGSAEIVF